MVITYRWVTMVIKFLVSFDVDDILETEKINSIFAWCDEQVFIYIFIVSSYRLFFSHISLFQKHSIDALVKITSASDFTTMPETWKQITLLIIKS